MPNIICKPRIVIKGGIGMIIKCVVGIFIYFILLAFICMFFKGATRLDNEYADYKERQIIIERLKNSNKMDN